MTRETGKRRRRQEGAKAADTIPPASSVKSAGAGSFDQALARLEEIAAKLESGELRLEEMVALAEEGLRLSQVCERQLSEAEGKIQQLVERMGRLELEPLDLAPQAEPAPPEDNEE